MATTVGVRELRQNLSVYLRRVEAGETFQVTERGRPVATLGPTADAAHPLADLIATGRIAQIGRGNLADLPLPPASGGALTLSQALEELRGEGP